MTPLKSVIQSNEPQEFCFNVSSEYLVVHRQDILIATISYILIARQLDSMLIL